MHNEDNAARKPVVIIVDDKVAKRISAQRLVRSAGFETEVFASASDLLESEVIREGVFPVRDIILPHTGDSDSRSSLFWCNPILPVIFVAVHDTDIGKRQAMNIGAIAFLGKPVPVEALVNAIQAAVRRAHAAVPKQGIIVVEETSRRRHALLHRMGGKSTQPAIEVGARYHEHTS